MASCNKLRGFSGAVENGPFGSSSEIARRSPPTGVTSPNNAPYPDLGQLGRGRVEYRVIGKSKRKAIVRLDHAVEAHCLVSDALSASLFSLVAS